MTDEAPSRDTFGAPPADTFEAPPGDTDEDLSGPAYEPSNPFANANRAKRLNKSVPAVPDDNFPRHPWERQPREPITAYHGFEAYRSMDPENRSLAAMSRVEITTVRDDGVSVKHSAWPYRRIVKWSGKWSWPKRAAAWDDEVARQTTAKMLRETVAMHDRHVRMSLQMQSVIVERLKDFKPEELSRRDLDRWFEAAVKIERQARGVDRIGQAGNVQNVAVNVNAGPSQTPPAPADNVFESPLSEYLMQNPGEVTGAIGTIHELLRFVSGETPG